MNPNARSRYGEEYPSSGSEQGLRARGIVGRAGGPRFTSIAALRNGLDLDELGELALNA